jgi:hypothetical protein
MQTKSLKIKSLLFAATALAILTTGAKADGVLLFAPAPGGVFQTNGGTGNGSEGPTTYTSGGFSVKASGFLDNNSPVNLFEKAQGTGENGLGLDTTVDNEINSPSQFIQFQILTIPSPLQLAMSFAAGSTTDGEGWEVLGTNTANTVVGATSLATCTSAGGSGTGNACETLVTIAGALGFTYIDVRALNGNMLVAELNAVPLPPAMLLFGSGLVGLGLIGRKKKLARTKTS